MIFSTVKKSESILVGRYNARAIYTASTFFNRPAVILIPGIGGNGPEEFIPGSMTTDSKDCLLFNEFAKAINEADVATLQIGKPGIDYLSAKPYNASMYENATWDDLLNNVIDAIQFLVKKGYNTTNIHLLGHSEGAVVAVDVASIYKEKLAGIILLGFVGENLLNMIKFQLLEAPIEYLIKSTIDSNHDNLITKEEVSKWNDTLVWKFKPNQTSVPIKEIRKFVKNDPIRLNLLKEIEQSSIWQKVLKRKNIYKLTANLSNFLNVKCFHGELDMHALVKNAVELKKSCERVLKKKNKNNNHKLCQVSIVKGVGHGFSVPKPPRSQMYADKTIGPPIQDFLDDLKNYAKT
ncbi:hypothetical protein HDU92_007881, partial [Lobulomyces angularis]